MGGVAVSENKMNNNKLPNMKVDLTSERRRRSRPQISFWRFEDKTRGREKEKTKSGKYKGVGQNLAHKSTVHAPSLTCFSCTQYRY